MILGVSAEQEELRASVRRFLTDRAPLPRVRALMDDGETDWAVWEQAGSQLGLQGLAIPESYGGAGFSFAEQAVVLEEFGAALYGGPYLARALLPALDQTRQLARLEFAGVTARLIGSPGDGAAALDRALDVAAVALAAEQLGGAQRALDMAVEYAKTRRQFDRPIGSFQAIKHRC